MARLAAGVTFFLVFLTCAALSVDSVKVGEDCTACEKFLEDFTRVKTSPDDEKELFDQCLKKCGHLFPSDFVQKPSSGSNSPSVRAESPTRRFFGPGRHLFQLLSFYMYKLMIFSVGILECSFDNSVLVLEASLDLPLGTFGRPRCDRIDLVALGVPPFYVKLLKAVARLIAPKRRGEDISESLLRGLEDDMYDSSNSPRVQRKAIQKILKRK